MNPWRKKLITEWAELSVSWFCLSLVNIQLGAWRMALDETMRAWGAADAGLRCAGLAWGIIDADRPAKLYRELPMPPARPDLHHVVVRLDGQILDPSQLTPEEEQAFVDALPCTCPVAELAELDAQSFDETDESIIKRTRTK